MLFFLHCQKFQEKALEPRTSSKYDLRGYF